MKLSAQKKKEAVLRVVESNERTASVAREYGIARKTLYSWISRYKKDKDTGVKTFTPRYVRGEKHPKAKYPQVEEKLLRIISENPLISISDLAKYVPVSLWTVWKILDKNNLNSKEERYKYSQDYKHKLYAQKKREAVLSVTEKKETIAKVARRYGVARKTLYVWLKRYNNERDSLDVFEKRYVKGKDHPNAIYPEIEEDLLVLVANYPELSTASLAERVPVSSWKIWKLLDKYNLNNKNQRIAFAQELLRRKDVSVSVYAPEISFGYVINKIQLLLSETRKIPKYVAVNLLTPLQNASSKVYSFVLSTVTKYANNFKSSIQLIYHDVKSLLVYPLRQITFNLRLFGKDIFAYSKTNIRYATYIVSLVLIAIVSISFSKSIDIFTQIKDTTQFSWIGKYVPLKKITLEKKKPLDSEFKVASADLILTGSSSYKTSDAPSFIIEKQTGMIERTKDNISRVLGIQDKPFFEPDITVTDIDGTIIEDVEVKQSTSGKYEVSLENSDKLKPGRYTIQVKDESGVSVIKEFSWGVLTVNSEKTAYALGEKVNLYISVVDENEKPVCDADMVMSLINNDNGREILLTTSDGEILVNDECSRKEKTLKPDYEVNLSDLRIGEYIATLITKVDDETYSIATNFEVSDSIPLREFDVTRAAPIRVGSGEEYPVVIKIIANVDYKGEVIDRLPENFLVKPFDAEGLENYELKDAKTDYGFVNKADGDEQTLVWNVDFKKGETYSLTYSFSDLGSDWTNYYLGPLSIDGKDVDKKWELRQDPTMPMGKITEKMRYGSLKAEDKILRLREKQFKVSMKKAHFAAGETPRIQLAQVNNDESILENLRKSLGISNEKTDGGENTTGIRIEVQDINGDIEFETEVGVKDAFIDIPTKNLKPGKHIVTIKDNDTGNFVEQTFLYGVLALNINKTVYEKGETAYIQMAALDDKGNTICDANLELIADFPDGETKSYKTGDQTISKSGGCGANNVTDHPDYYVNLPLDTSGEYQLQLINLQNGFTNEAIFEAVESSDFSIERVGATRINPFRAKYSMTFNIESSEDISGYLTEVVPMDFEITGSEEHILVKSGDKKEIVWNVELESGEKKSFSYEYQAPKVSPELYLLGEAGLEKEGKTVFAETRKWQLASDAQYARPDSDVSKGNWTDATGGDNDGVLYDEIDETTASDTDYIQSGNNPSSDAFEVGLSDVTDPESTDTHTVRVRERMMESGGGQPANTSVTIYLMQGTSTIASGNYTHGNNDITTWYTRSFNLTTTEIGNITDYSDLRIRVSATKTGGGRTPWIEVSWAELETPDPPPNSPPTITVDEPDGSGDTIAEGANFIVQYDLADTDDTVTADFYYDTDSSGLDGSAISGCQDQAEGTDQTCSWNTTGVAPGTYYVYGVVNDGINPTVNDYSGGVVTINDAPEINIDQPDGTDDTVAEGANFTVQYDLSDTDDTVTANFYYDTDGSGLDGIAITGCASQGEGADQTCSWDTTGVTPGTYYVYGIVSDGINPTVNDYSGGAVTINDAPEITVDEPNGTDDTIAEGANFTVQYDLSDTDDTVTANFYYDTNDSGLDGVAISGCSSQGEGTDQTCNWDTTGVAPGTYYIYGIVNDGTNPDVSNYSSGVVTINNAPEITVDEPDGVSDAIVEGGSFTVQYDLADSDDTVTADFYYDTNGTGLDGVAISGCQDKAEGIDQTCNWDTTGVTPGTYYVYGVVNDGINSQQSSYSTGVVTINDAPDITVDEPDGVSDEIAEGANFTVQYDLSDTDDMVTADFYYDTDNSGLDGVAISGCASQGEGINQTCNWDTTGISPGTYYIYGISSDGTNPSQSVYSGGVVTINDAPTINVDEPDGSGDTIVEDGSFTVQYDLTDTDDTVTADFYYDTDNSGLDGVAISGCQDQVEGNDQTCSWNTTGVAPGTYYVYGIASDGTNPAVSDYSGGVVTIDDAPGINIDQPDGVDDEITEGNNFTVQYDLSDIDDTVTADIYYDTNNSGLDGTAISGCQDQSEGTDQTCNWDTTGVSPGTYYVYGVSSDGFNPSQSAYSSGVVTIISGSNDPPTINVDDPDGVDDEIAVGANFTVTYDLDDTDDTVTADFYYDTNSTGLDGVAISGCANEAEGTDQTCNWDTTGVASGTYYVYGITDDGTNPAVSDYSSGVVTINGPPEINIDEPDGVSDEIGEGTNFTVQYDLSDATDTVTADFYYDTDATGLDGVAISGCQDQSEGTNQTCNWDTTGITPGTYYIYGIVNDGFNPQEDDYSAGVVTINDAPTINVDEPDGVSDEITEGANFTVQYDLTDTDDTVTADFYYDPNGIGLDGVAITGCQDKGEGTNQTCNWDTTGVTPGTYYIYGVVSDGVNSQVNSYSSGVVTINDAPDINVDEPDGVGDEIAENAGFTVQYDLTDTDDTVTADFYYDTDSSGLDGVAISGCASQGEGINQTCNWDTTGVAPGTYYVYGVVSDGTNPSQSAYSSGVVTINDAPTINVDEPDGVSDEIAEGANFTVKYDLADTDNLVTADFYYDTDGSGLDGSAISGCANQAEGTDQTCIWDTTGVTPGTYYVYGVTDDGVNSEVSDYSSGVVTINDAPTINVDEPDGVSDEIAESANFTVQYDLSDTDDTVTADFYYDTDAAGLDGTAITGCALKGEGTDQTCSWDTTGVAPGTYYVYGIVSDGINSSVSNYSSDVVTINSAPEITVDEPDGVSDSVTEGDNYNVQYDLSDTDDTVTANFYYDSNNSGLDGTAITGCASQGEGTGQTCIWDTTGVTPGTYYVYGVTNDGVNSEVNDYSSGVLTINVAPTSYEIFITGETSWEVPPDWDDNSNTIEVIGGGGGGANGSSSTPGTGGAGGGGGGYSSVSNVNLTPGSSVTISVGSGGTVGNAGTSTYFNGTSCGASSVCATGGGAASGTTGGAGGSASVGTGYTGGTGGGGGAAANGGGGGGGGAGAAGLNANGNNGSVGSGASGNTGGVGGAGGQGDGTSGGIGGTAGSSGGGTGGDGGNGTEWDATHGSGGGPGGGGGANRNGSAGSAGAAGQYGSGGGGGGGNATGGTGAGGGSGGKQGLIIVYYTESTNLAPQIHVDEPDGVNDKIAEDSNFTVQYDLSDADDTVTADFYYDADGSGLDGTAISGCQDQAEGTDQTCNWDTTGVTPGTYYIYGIADDGEAAAQSAYSDGVVTINSTPEVANVSLNSGSSIDLSADTTTAVNLTATITDLDGYSDIQTATGSAYRSGVANAQDCDPNDNNCYYDTSCALSNCSGNSCTATCSVDIAFFADATDTGTYSSEYWLAWIWAEDGMDTEGEEFSPNDTTDIKSLLTISTTSPISYGLVYPDNVSSEKTVAVTNTGNRIIDLRISGNDMCSDYPTCSEYKIPVGNQEFDSTSFTYGSGHPLSASTYDLDTNIAKSSVIPSNSTGNTYWILGVPPTTIPAAYTGSNTIISIVSP